MALEGPLKEFHIQDVFQLLDLGRKTGVLRVTSELRQTSASVTFDRGGVVAGSMGKNPQRFGARLVRLGKISAKDLDRALAQQEKGDSRRLGDILVGNGAINRRELDRQLKAQIEEAILDLLGWTEGHFRFEESAVSEALVESPIRIPTEGLLMESARRSDEWSRMEDKLPHLRVVPKLPPPDSAAKGKLDLLPFQWEVLAAVDGLRDLQTLADLLGKSEFDVARTIYTLAEAGVVVLDAGSSHNGKDHTTPLLARTRSVGQGAIRTGRSGGAGGSSSGSVDAGGTSADGGVSGGAGSISRRSGDVEELVAAGHADPGGRSAISRGRALETSRGNPGGRAGELS